MHKVEERLICNPLKELVHCELANLVPADLRDDKVIAKPSHTSSHKPESGRTAKFIRLFEKHLHTNTDTKQRYSFSYSFTNEIIEATFTQRLHASAKRADSG